MKKKIFSILTAVFIFVMCGVFSACGDRYEDMKFKIYYAFSEDASEWYDATNGIELNYGGEEDEFQISEETGVGTLYIKVKISNVKSKYIDEIIVTKRGTSEGINFPSSGGINSSSITVEQNEVFNIDIRGNTNSSLRFYETESGRHFDIDLSIYRSLTGIQVDTSIKPAVKVGDTISLMSLKNLYYLPMQNGNTLTNQTGVDYQILGIGYYSNQTNQDGQNEFILVRNETYALQYISISENGVLTVNSNLTINANEHIVRVSATSKHNPNITAEFDVYLVEEQDFVPSVYYSSDPTQEELEHSLTLYNENENYASTSLTIDTQELISVYKTPINTINQNDQVNYEICVYVDGKLVDLSTSQVINGLLIERLNESNTQIRLTSTSDSYPTNTVKITYELNDLDFSASNAPNYSREIVINKSVLPENISINDVLPELTDSKGSMEGIIYSSNSTAYQGLSLTLLAVPANANQNTDIYITGNENVIITGEVENLGSNTYVLESGSTIYISIRANVDADQIITFSTQVTPTMFENQVISQRFVEISYRLRKVVTADSIEIYADESQTAPITNSVLNIDATNSTDAYVKVYYTGTTLETSSIRLQSDNPLIRFENNSTSILLNDPTVERLQIAQTDANAKYDLFRVSFLNTSALETANISVSAGEGSVGVDTGFAVNSVYLLQEDSISVQSSSRNVTTFDDIDNGHFNFAVAKNQLVEFSILARVQGGSVLNDTGIVNFTIDANADFDSNYGGNNNFSTSALSYNKLDTNEFSLTGQIGAKTTVLTINVSYYAKINDIILLTNQIIFADIAVYDPISEIYRTISADEIVYINEYYESASTSEITFASYASNYSAASNSVVFSGPDGTEIVKTDASQLRLEINRDLEIDNTIEIYLVNEDGEEVAITDESILKIGSENILAGTLRVKLNGVSDYNSLTISLTALRFGVESNTAISATIEFAEHEPVAGISLSGNSIVQNGVDSYYVYMSFIDVPENGNTSAEFTATPYYESNIATGLRRGDLTYNLYQIRQDEDGNIVRDENGQALEDAVTSNRLNITIDPDTHLVTIRASQTLGGGLFRLELASLDSYDSTIQAYTTTRSLFISISDGTPQNKYIINDIEDLYNINNNLDANYVLRNNITVGDIVIDGQTVSVAPIGGENAFNGTLTGTVENLNSDNEIVTTRYKITLNLKNYVLNTNNSVYAGLFTRLGSEAVISDLDIDVNFDLSNFTSTAGGELNIGAIAGANEGGMIRDVNVTLLGGSQDNIYFATDKISTPINFGGVVGINSGYIDLTSSIVNADSQISIYTNTAVQHNIGMVAGKNLGEIYGAYLGKNSLNNVDYSVIANIVLINSATNTPTLYMGSVVGYNLGGYIHNLISGGFIRVTDNKNVANMREISGFVAGIAGYSDDNAGSSVSVKGIETVAVLGLDLYADNSNLAVAGIVGQSIGSMITDVRVLASKVSFDQGLTSYGVISGQGNVAGIVADSERDTITFASVESFISNTTTSSGAEETFYMLYSTRNNVAGLIYTASNTTLSNSFVSANIDTNLDTISDLKTIILTSNANEFNVYFLGRVNNIDMIQSNIYSRDTNAGYYVVYTDNSIIDFNANTPNELDLSQYFDVRVINREELYSTQQFLQETDITSEEFDSQREYLYISTDGVYSRVASDALFDENTTYYLFDNNLWQNNRASLYVANSEGYLLALTDFNFNPNVTYYSIENVNIRDYYILDENSDYIKNDNSNININTTYYELTWKSSDNIWESTVLTWIGTDSNQWAISSERNFVSIYGMNFYFPYLLDDQGNILMIERPTEIQASINANYVIEINSSFVDKDYSINEYAVSSTTIVNYHSDVNNPLNNETYNRYNIVNTASDGNTPNGLVDLNVIPSNAQGGVRFEIVRGSAYAYINAQNQIVFTGVSGANPIIVRCYSIFNDELEEYVVFFTQLGLSDLMLTSNSIYSVDEDGVDFELYTHTGANPTLVSIMAENIYQGQEFASILDAGINNYLQVEAVSNSGNSILNIVNANSTNGIMVQVEDDNFDGNLTTEMITFTLRLNLTEYFGEQFYPQVEGVDQYLELASSNLRVVIYKTATNIEIDDGDNSVETSANINLGVKLYTGYVGEEESGFAPDYTVNNTVMLREENKDSINLTMDVISGQDELEDLLENAGVDYIVELFDFDFYYSLLTIGNGEVQGYQYSIEMSLKDQFEFRYITSNIEFRLTVYGANNTTITDSVLITFRPTELSTVRIENYTATNVTTITNYTSLIESNATETSIVSPGGYGGVMMVYLEPSYSNILSATLTSSTLYIPSLGRNVSIIFEQLVKNENGDYETVYPNNETVNGGIKLRLVSSVDRSGNYSYNGIIYIHTQMDRFVGMTGTIEAKLTVNTNDGKTIEQTKTLITEYLPGATLSYDGISVGTDEYLIQKDTYNNEVNIRIYGYQFNSNPRVNFVWKLNDGDTNYTYDKRLATDVNETNFEERKLSLYTLDNGIYQKCDEDSSFVLGQVYYEDNRNVVIDNHGNNYNILDYVSYRFLDNFDQVTQNSDGSYSMTILLNVAPNIPAGFEMNATLTLATSESLITSEQEDSLIFYPVDYILNSVFASNLTNGSLNIAYNRSSSINLSFETNNPNNDLSDSVYNKLLQDIGVGNLASLFMYMNSNGEIVQFSDPAESHPEFSINIVNGRLTITGQDAFYRTVEFSVHYGYVLENGQYVLKFGTMSSNSLNQTLEFSFTLNIYASTTEENAIPIYSVDDIFNPDTGECILGKDADYILMNDIVLENFVPLDVDIASLDGNNKVIKIRSFAVSVDRSEYGLFANIGTYQDINKVTQTTILKNVIVDYSEFDTSLNLTNNDITSVTFGGLVAVNNGLIYNCDVLNLGTSTKTINILLDNDSDVEIVFGGLVGRNAGIITNSRVGRLGYTKITANENSETSVQQGGSPLQFVIGNNSSISQSGQGFVGITAGFVGENMGTIASSYVVNTGLTNYSTAPEGTGDSYSITAGFVGENSGDISFSYVKALESTISETNPYSTGVEIYSPTNGNVAGFVYLNSGNINNSFANTVLTSTSAYVAGFVYNNQSSGVISESYSASTLNGVFTANDASEQPFVGVSSSDELLSFGRLENTYYLIDENNSFIVKTESGKDQATGLNQDSFNVSDNLNGFVFIASNSRTERNQGVWSYYNQNNSFRILPELTNANQIAHSYRYLLRQENSVYYYSNAVSYLPGSVNNPNIIRSVKEYNEIMLSGDTLDSMTGYVRFINDIDFASDETAIKTRVNFTLGDENNNSITSIEGNGMTISGIYLDVGNAEEKSIGLFAQVVNSYVKNLNLKFATTTETDGQFSSLSAIYSGGLAGRIDNSVIINIDLDGQNTTISGQNFAGGLAGMITGSSLIYGIDSNLSVKAVNTDTNHYYNYYSEQDFNTMRAFGAINYTGSYADYLTRLSFAGGIAGVIDLDTRQYVDFNLSYINVYGNEMYDKREIDANILADYAGGIAGYAGRETTSLRLKYFVGQTNLIRGQYAVGGIFAVSSGDITASQVTAEEDDQFDYDTKLGEYILDLENGEEAVLDTTQTGNLNLLETYGYGGGLIGISISSRLDSCYSKAGFKVGSTIGGLIGVSIGANIIYSYAVPYVNVNDTYLMKVGGLIGSAYGSRSGVIDRNEEVSEYINYLTLIMGETNKNTDIQFTFSTILMDVNDITTKNTVTQDYINFDYICADYGQFDGNSTGYLTSNNGSALLYVFAGRVGAYDSITDGGESIVKHSNEARASDEEIKLLYDTSEDNVEQVSTFNNIFSGWDTRYWTLNAERYFPLLLNEEVENYTIIETADDFYQLVNDPDGSFMIVNDIDMTEWCARNNSNFIFDIEFTGVLIGQKEDDSIPILYNLFLNPMNAEDAGLFRSTSEATLRNITFEWGSNINEMNVADVSSSVILGNTIDTFGGVSALDNGSLFSNLTVRVTNENSSTNTGRETSLFNSNNGTIAGFGGIVGRATNSNILNCTFSGRVDVTLSSMGTNSSIHFGGLVAESDILENPENEDEEVNMTIMNSTVGIDNTNTTNAIERTVFNLNIANGANAYIGGAVGYASNTSIASITVGHYAYETNYRRITFNINLDNSNANNYFGGAIGGLEGSQLSTIDAITEVNISGSENRAIEDTSTTSYINAYAGLVGYYTIAGSGSSNLSITSANTSSNINVLGDTQITNLYLSSGVAIAESYNESMLSINQSLFTGTISTEDSEGVDSDLRNVYASGVVAYAGDDSGLSINEVMTTTDIIVGSVTTTRLYAGSMVGQANLVTATNFASTGRIVPITAYSDDHTNNHFYIGGFIGQAENATIINAYSLTSIIIDSIDYQAIQALNINALFGAINIVSTEYVYYSSDYALFSEESGAGYNLSAYTLTRNNAWRLDTNNGLNSRNGFWGELNSSSGSYYLPYIASLSAQLVNYGILRQTDNTYSYLLSALNPTIIDSGNMNVLVSSDDEFKYYILSNNITDSIRATGEAGGALNGILIGGETEYTQFISSSVYSSTEGTFSGIIPKVNRHSAISNLHIKFSSDIAYDLGSGNISGVIAGLNEGVIFNSSIQGTGAKISSNNLGLIAGRNSGLISYSYSSLEVVQVSASSIAGITYQNQGMILSCYFTGYINNVIQTGDTTAVSAVSAGIVIENVSEGNQQNFANNFIYNTYSTGVIESISTQGNSFIANLSGLMGANNYVDSLANIEQFNITNEETNVTILSTINTATLMSAEVLDGFEDGKWYYTTRKIDNNYYLIDRDSKTFGYNYLYPTVRIDKMVVDGFTDWTDPNSYEYFDNNYQLYTGTGSISIDLGQGYEDVVNALSSTSELSESTKANLMRIPHLGLLSAIQSLAMDYGDNAESPTFTGENTSLYYVLIYDINARMANGTHLDWSPVGSANENAQANAFYNGSQASFAGFFISNKNYAFSELSLENACQISGLNGSVFANIKDAYFGYLKLGGSDETLENAGLLGENINPDVEDAQTADNVIVDKIEIVQNTQIAGSGYVSGLFGVISSGNVSIKDFVTFNSDEVGSIRPNLTINSADFAGLIAGKVESGNLKLGFTPDGLTNVEGLNGTKDSFYVRFGENIGYAGGLIGYIDNFTPNIDASAYKANETGSNNKVNIFTTEGGVSTLGGIVGAVVGDDAEAVATISNLTVVLNKGGTNAGAETPNKISVFGGLVAQIGIDMVDLNNSTINFENCGLDLGEQGLTITTDTNTDVEVGNYFGLLSAKVGGGTLNVQDFYFTGEENSLKVTYETTAQLGNTQEGVDYTASKENTQGVGMLAGKLSGNANLIFNYGIDMTLPELHAVNTYNLGGIVGVYESGSIGIVHNEDNLYSVKLYGTTNVGGAVGLVSENGSEDISDIILTNSGDGTTYFDFLTSDVTYAAIYADQQGYNNRFNWGGLFGYYKKGELRYQANDFVTGEGGSDTATITGNNLILVGSTPGEETKYIYNIGGIAGRISEDTTLVENLENSDTSLIGPNSESGSIWGINNDNSEFDLNVAVGAQVDNTIRMVNVGGTIGYVVSNADVKIVNIKNSADIITGYQNVGGLIGYVGENVTVENTIEFVPTSNIEAGNQYYDSNYELCIADGSEGELYELSSNSVSSTGKVVGAVNVGGAFGHFEGDLASNIWTEANVYGNASVGGFVGYINNANSVIDGNIVAKQNSSDTTIENEQLLEVKGIYLAIGMSTIEYGILQTGYEYYIPTSVGGFIGTAEAGTVQNNCVYDTNVLSTNEGDVLYDDGNNITVSTISNNMVEFYFGGGTTNPNDPTEAFEYYSYNDENSYVSEATTDFNEMTSGFGGFIGSVMSDVTHIVSGGLRAIESNKVQANVDAQLGVNVGAYYGFYYASDSTTVDATETLIITPELLSDVSVDGGYNIGGILGYYEGTANLSQYSLADANGQGTINIQSKYTGMYVGGLFGKLVSNDAELTIEESSVKISIDTDSSYYIGGLIGKLEFTSNRNNEGNFLGNISDNIYVTDSGSYDDVGSATNFGGFIGMLKLPYTGRNFTANVMGTHHYPFTINIVENSNYADGESYFDVDDQSEEGSVIMVAQAYYINLDVLNIAGSSNESFYSEDAHNPINSSAKGWHKDYTAFRMIQRCIPQADDIGWDSLAVIYDAANITHVGTIKNLELENTRLNGNIEDWNEVVSIVENSTHLEMNANGTRVIEPSATDLEAVREYNSLKLVRKFSDTLYYYNPNYICFTVYEDEEGSPSLYSAMGIATPEINNTEEENASGYKTLKDGAPSALDYILGALVTESPKSLYYLDMNKSANNNQGLTYFIWDKNYTSLGGTSNVSYQNQPNSWRFISYYVSDYMQGDESLAGDATYGRNHTGAYFVFSVVYDNATLEGLTAGDNTYVEQVSYDLPRSGSIFEVSGFSTSQAAALQANADAVDVFGWVMFGLSVALDVALLVASLGVAGPLAAAGKFAGNMLNNVVKSGAKTGLKKLLRVLQRTALVSMLAATVTIGVNILNQHFLSQQISKTMFLEQKDQNFGVLSSSYSRNINYTNGVIDDTFDYLYVDDYGNTYSAFSSTRPNDYYSHYYTATPVDNLGMEEAHTSLMSRGSLTIIYSPTDEDISISGSNSEEIISAIQDAGYYYAEDTAGNEYFVLPTYTYINGMYYISVEAGQVDTTPAQPFFIEEMINVSGVLTERRGAYKIDPKRYGYIYVYGIFDDTTGTYSIGDIGPSGDYESAYPTNNLKYNGSYYYTIDESKQFTSLRGATPTKNVDYQYTINTEAFDRSIALLGYDYFEGAYYTASGTNIDNAEQKVGRFVYQNREPSNDERYGIDYISVPYYQIIENDDGTTTVLDPEIYYFYISSISNSADFDSALIYSSIPALSAPPSSGTSYDIKLYPYGFIDPYESTISNSKDSNLYTLVSNSASTSPTITQAVTYYYYDGGYQVKANSEGEDRVYTVIENYNLNDTSSTYYDAITINLSTEKDGSDSATYTLADLASYVEREGSTSILDEYYVADLIAGDTTQEQEEELVRLTDLYIYDTDENLWYQISSSYVLDETTGILSSITIKYINASNMNYNFNKFATYPKINLYTRYRYSIQEGTTQSQLTEEWTRYIKELSGDGNTEEGTKVAEKSGYYLVPSIQNLEGYSGSPNIGHTTILVERVKITFGGGKNLSKIASDTNGSIGMGGNTGSINVY